MKKYAQSIEEGNISENKFELLAKNKNFEVIEATKNENIYDHIDFYIKRGQLTRTVDVKALKRVSRANKNKSNDLVWIELQNVIGNNGWLYGKQDLIAFEQLEYYILVTRKDLEDFVVSKLRNNQSNYINGNMVYVENSYHALYRFYQRKNRKDIITTIKREDLYKINHRIWHK